MYFGTILNEYLYAVDLISGQKKWISEVDSWTSAGAPALSRGKVFIGGRVSGYMSAFDERDGTLQWQYYAGGITSTPVIFEDRIFFSNASGYLFSLNLSARGIV
jgi:outer membrane protein assembly factor BamB